MDAGALVELRNKGRLPLRELGLQPPAIIGRHPFPGRVGHPPAIGVAQGIPVAHVQDHREAVSQRRIERFGAEILFAGGLVGRARVHRRPAVAQSGERKALNLPFVDQREEAVLVFGLAAADLVDEHRLRAPDRGRRLEEPDRGLGLVRVGEPHEVVERDQAGVVVAMLEPKRLADGIEQERLARAAPADEQNRVAARERGENHGFLRVEAVGAEGGQAAA